MRSILISTLTRALIPGGGYHGSGYDRKDSSGRKWISLAFDSGMDYH
jgi:hypothetical protein